MFTNFNKVLYIKICLVIISFCLIFSCSKVFAAEDLSQQRVKIDSATQKTYPNGRKVVQIQATKGITVNGSFKELRGTTQIVPRNAYVGRTMMRRLAIPALVGTASVIAVKSLLDQLKYKVDPNTGEVYKDLINDENWGWMCQGVFYTNLDDLASCFEQNYNAINPSIPAKTDRVELSEDGKIVYWWATRKYGTEEYTSLLSSAHGQPNPNGTGSTSPQRKALTEIELGDIMLGVSPEHKTGAWTGVEDAFIPVDEYEEQNNPNYKQVIESFTPTSTDTTISPNTDPSTGENTGWKIPDFCDWATRLCDWLDWTQQVPEQDTELDFEDEQPINIDTVIRFNGQCPAPLTYDFNYGGQSQSFGIKDFTPFCSMLNDILKPIVIAVSSFVAVLIIGGVRTDE